MKLICDCFEIEHLDEYVSMGVDRVIFSLPHVSARPVRVYDEQQISSVVKQAHTQQLEVGVNMLNFMMEEDVDQFKHVLTFCDKNEIDCIYFSDMGVYQLAKEMGMCDKLIYQPTTLVASSQDANEYLSLGIKGVCLSREITLEEMREILSACSQCEVSVFGYNVMMHSRRQLLSNYFEFIGKKDRSQSKNLTVVEEKRDERMPIFQDETGTHMLSGSIFCMFKEMNELPTCDMRIEGIGLDEKIVLQVARDIGRIINKEVSGIDLFEAYQAQYPEYLFSDGFMYKKTSTVKEAEK